MTNYHIFATGAVHGTPVASAALTLLPLATLPFGPDGPAPTSVEIASASRTVLLRFRPRFTVLADVVSSTASRVAFLDFRSSLALALAAWAAVPRLHSHPF
jgi:hypothetical protein